MDVNVKALSQDQLKISALLSELSRADRAYSTKSTTSRFVDSLLLASILCFLVLVCSAFVAIPGGEEAGTARAVGIVAAGLIVLCLFAILFTTSIFAMRQGLKTLRMGVATFYAEQIDQRRNIELSMSINLTRHPLAVLERLGRRVKSELDVISHRITGCAVVAGVALATEKLSTGSPLLFNSMSFATIGNAFALGAGLGAILLFPVREALKRLEGVITDAIEGARPALQPATIASTEDATSTCQQDVHSPPHLPKEQKSVALQFSLPKTKAAAKMASEVL